ncbi:MAG: N-acetylmuramoyl-L-alanine amidase [Acidimicrobiales bacterium]
MKRVAAATVSVMLAYWILAADIGGATPVLIPETLADSRPLTAGPVEPGFPIDFVAVTWLGPADGHDGAAVRFRRGAVWDPWQPLEEDGAQQEGAFGSALVPAGDADAYQVRGLPPGLVEPKAVALNTTDGPLVEVGRRRQGAAHAASPCRSRADWGADESLMSWTPTYYGVQVLTLHHTATANDDVDPSATMRAIYRYHAVERNFGDIGYQHVVDQAGVVYEGRFSGLSKSCLSGGGDGSDFAHDGAGGGVTGAHVSGMNSGNIGVALLGTYGTVVPPAAQRTAAEQQLADLATRHRIDPERLDYGYVNPVNGATKTIATISGHRDWLATDCPGGELYAQLPSIRSNVKAQMATSSSTTTSSTTSTTTTVAPAIQLSVSGRKVKGIQYADLQWSGATTATVDVRRNGVVVAAGTPNDGVHIDRLGKLQGTYTYRLCEAGRSTCSPDVKATFA